MLKVNLKKVKIDDDVMVVDKPKGWTSHDVVAKIRNGLYKQEGKKVKVGHGGTLDPFATGVLLILIGKATRSFETIKGLDKEYEMEIKLGEETDTGDSQGKVINKLKVGGITEEKAKAALRGFKGSYEQKVPIYSAVKIKGRRLYELARKGEKVKLPKRQVKIKEIELIEFKGLSLKVRVVCGSGTYMRQLAVDIGKELKIPAHAKELRRLRVGKFVI